MRSQDVVLGLPVAADELATTLRPLMADVDCIVGPAVPITEFPDSLAMGQRLSALRAVAHSGPTFVDGWHVTVIDMEGRRVDRLRFASSSPDGSAVLGEGGEAR